MSRGYTYYELFDLDEHATAQQVRTAYLRLMKQHHPDKSTVQQTPGFVALINLCYETLSDPIKRAAYDAGLRRSNLAAAVSFSPRTGAGRGRSPKRLATAILVGAGCFSAMIAFGASESFSFPQTPVFQWAGTV